jgi:hypothetical protein
MSTDFGAELDAALKGHIDVIRAAGEAAKERVDDAIAGVPEEPPSNFAAPPASDAALAHGPAVDFGLDEAPLEFDHTLDADGVPMPEEI